jgi:hypothetical protein
VTRRPAAHDGAPRPPTPPGIRLRRRDASLTRAVTVTVTVTVAVTWPAGQSRWPASGRPGRGMLGRIWDSGCDRDGDVMAAADRRRTRDSESDAGRWRTRTQS